MISQSQNINTESIENIPLDIIIFDTVFPHPASGFRRQEYTSILENFNNSQVISYVADGWMLGGQPEQFVKEYKYSYPNIAHKLRVASLKTGSYFKELIEIDAKLLYTIFLDNIYQVLEIVEYKKLPFVFTLYPGGGFAINNAKSDAKLELIFSSICFRGVIVTQQNVYDYLVQKKFCKKEYIHFIFGVVVPLENVNRETAKTFQVDEKTTIDICFAAHKYSQFGLDKGYDLFIDTAKKLCAIYDNMYFHVVGSFSEDDIDITEITKFIKFYGVMPQEKLSKFFENIDIIVCPNRPNVLAAGAFDGFPTGTVVDAMLSKVAAFCTDELALNQGYFENEKEIIIIKPDVEHIVSCIDNYVKHPEQLKSISEAGCIRAKDLYSYKTQIASRIDVLQMVLKKWEVPRRGWAYTYLMPPYIQKFYLSLRARQHRALAKNYIKIFISYVYDECVAEILKLVYRKTLKSLIKNFKKNRCFMKIIANMNGAKYDK